MARKTAEARDLTSYLDFIYAFADGKPGHLCYRGQSDKAWTVKPSILRGLKPDAEHQVLSELLVEAPGEFANDKSMFDKLVRAQHYGLPTRLLDVTLNPLVGLYFACEDSAYENVDGVVQAFEFAQRRTKFADSDTVSVICNLARLSDKEKKTIDEAYQRVGPRLLDWDDSSRAEFRELPEVKRLMQFVRVEKPYFLDALNPHDLFKYHFVYPAKNNKRLIAQSGAFIAAGLLEYRGLERSRGLEHRKIVIPADCKPCILKQLDTLHINSRSMFPEVQYASTYIKKKWTAS